MKIYYQKNEFNKISSYSFTENDGMLSADITEEEYQLLEKHLGNCAVRETENGIELYYAELSQEEQNRLTAIRQKALPYEIRERRKAECFPYINRGELWYKNLSEEQKTELETWYQSWLNAPQTLTVPDKPEWLE
jgi:hypothetical protein